MYFNEETNKTNIDQEFENKKQSMLGILLNKKMFLIIGIVVVLIVLGILLMPKGEKIEYFLTLNGLEDITIYQNTAFVDPGYMAYDNNGNDYTNEVIITGNVNTSVAGEYVINYSFNEIEKERVVTVIGEINQITYLNLIGSHVIYLKVNDSYQEPGYIVLDTVEDNLQDKVKIEGKVDTKKAGTYKLVYSVINSSGVTITEERTVIVMDAEINVSYSPMEVTNQDVVITIKVDANYFDYVLLPDGTRSTNRLTEYKVSKNDNYMFKVYSKDGSYKENTIKISNIDKINPVIDKCLANVDNGKTNIFVNSSDQGAGIDTYNYYINGSLVKKTSVNSYVYLGTDVNNVKVSVSDKAGNISEKECSITKPRPSSSSSSKSSSSSSKSSSYDSDSKPSYSGGTTYYTAFGYQYVIPKTKNDLQIFVNKVERKISQTALDTCHDACLSVSKYHAYMIQHGNLSNINVKDACDWKYAAEFKTVFYDTSKEVLYKVYEEINAGKVIVIQVNGSAGRHFALAVGYRSRVKRKEDMTEADLLIIDSWDGLLETMDKSISPKGRYLWKRSNQGWRVDIFK